MRPPCRTWFPAARSIIEMPDGPARTTSKKEKGGTAMRSFMLVVCSLVLCVAACAAKDKISSQWKCNGQPTVEHSIAVGDHDGHTYHLSQGTCTSEKGSMGDAKEQEGTY